MLGALTNNQVPSALALTLVPYASPVLLPQGLVNVCINELTNDLNNKSLKNPKITKMSNDFWKKYLEKM